MSVLLALRNEDVFPHAMARDQIVVTVNVVDFMRLAAAIEVHPGVIAPREAGLNAEEQWLRVQSAIQLITKAVTMTWLIGCL
jgi:hypothetical protein